MPKAIETLEQYCKNFVAYKHASGVAFGRPEKILKRFLFHCRDYVDEICCLPKEAVITWNQKTAYEKLNNQRVRVNMVRAFAIYLQAQGIPAYIGESVKHPNSGFVPYIFNNEELSRFFAEADNCKSNNISPNRRFVMPVLFRLIYSSGLRLSEATRLRVCDVDLETGVVTILNTKMDKDRLIPVDTQMLKRLNVYAKQVLPLSKQNEPFFPAPENRFYSPGSIYQAFRDILWKAGISHGGKGFGPRVHDLRHTFAVHCLRKWVLAGDDITTAFPYLSAYMGHDGIRYSQLYLRLTAEMYPDIVERMERKFDVLPDMEGVL